MTFKHIATTAAAAMLLSAPAIAENAGYVGILGGWNTPSEQKWNATDNADVKTTLDNGYNVSLFGGYSFGSTTSGTPRAEVELSWANASVKDHKVNGNKIGSPKGEYNEKAVFVNGFYDFDGAGSQWVPYIGGGIGYGNLEFKNYGGGGDKALDDSANVWGYQVAAGIGYQINYNSRIFADVRYRAYQDAKVKSEFNNSTKISVASTALNIGYIYGF